MAEVTGDAEADEELEENGVFQDLLEKQANLASGVNKGNEVSRAFLDHWAPKATPVHLVPQASPGNKAFRDPQDLWAFREPLDLLVFQEKMDTWACLVIVESLVFLAVLVSLDLLV